MAAFPLLHRQLLRQSCKLPLLRLELPLLRVELPLLHFEQRLRMRRRSATGHRRRRAIALRGCCGCVRLLQCLRTRAECSRPDAGNRCEPRAPSMPTVAPVMLGKSLLNDVLLFDHVQLQKQSNCWELGRR